VELVGPLENGHRPFLRIADHPHGDVNFRQRLGQAFNFGDDLLLADLHLSHAFCAGDSDLPPISRFVRSDL